MCLFPPTASQLGAEARIDAAVQVNCKPVQFSYLHEALVQLRGAVPVCFGGAFAASIAQPGCAGTPSPYQLGLQQN